MNVSLFFIVTFILYNLNYLDAIYAANLQAVSKYRYNYQVAYLMKSINALFSLIIMR